MVSGHGQEQASVSNDDAKTWTVSLMIESGQWQGLHQTKTQLRDDIS